MEAKILLRLHRNAEGRRGRYHGLRRKLVFGYCPYPFQRLNVSDILSKVHPNTAPVQRLPSWDRPGLTLPAQTRSRCGPRGVSMENYFSLLRSTTLFAGLEEAQLRVLLAELHAWTRSYGRGEALILAGHPNRRVGVLLSGALEAYRPAPGGSRVPITRLEPGDIFGDVLGGSSLSSPVTVVAASPCEALLIPYEQLLQTGTDPAHTLVLQNLVRTISDKYFLLSRRVDLLVMKTLRAKVCAYLLGEAERAGSLTFTIPFSRIQLADYLNCDRSALSRELSLMQRDGLLDTYKSSFKLLEPDALRRTIQ